MSADPAPVAAAVAPWAARRARAQELRDRHPFAADPLTLYLALLPVQEDAWRAVREHAPEADELADWAAEQVLPDVVEATAAAGPPALVEAMRARSAAADHAALEGWLAGAELGAVDRYVARACLGPVLEALGERAGAACSADADDGVACPTCGGRPQVSFVTSSGEALVSGRRSLVCARCASTWSISRSTCSACGETDNARLVVYAEHWSGPVTANGKDKREERAMFPHLRIAGCTTCHRYLIDVDLERDGRAVPEVDELAALPLDLYAADQGLTKLTPNLMGF